MRKSKISAMNPPPSNVRVSKHHSRKSKIIPKIDDVFFENLFILEMNYRKTLNPDYINQIVTHYMMAIEYYEYKKDPKCEDYQNRLRFFMIQPDVIKFLNKKKQPDQNTLKSSKRVVKRKNEYKIKFDYLSKINFASGAGKETLNQAKKRFGKERRQEIENKVKNLISTDLDNQSKSFKERLMKRKNKMNKIENSIEPNIESVSDHQSPRRVDTEIQEEENDEEEMDIKRVQTEVFNNDEESDGENVVNIDTLDDFIAESEAIIQDAEEEKEPKEEANEIFPSNQKEDILSNVKQYKDVSDSEDDSIDSEDSSLDNKNEIDDEEAENLNSRTTQLFTGLEDNKNIGPKQQKGFNDIRNTLDKYVNNFNKSFYTDVFVKFCKNVKKLVDEKFNKYIEITHMYQEQIKEIKTQLVQIEKGSAKYTELEGVIESLKEEQRNELDEIEDEYNEKIQTFQRNFKTNEFKTNPALLLLEEQFRLSMCNKINDLILPD